MGSKLKYKINLLCFIEWWNWKEKLTEKGTRKIRKRIRIKIEIKNKNNVVVELAIIKDSK